jgi:adenylosuccinate lyase
VHEAIKEHAIAAALAMREEAADNDLAQRLGADDRVPLQTAQVMEVLSHSADFIGLAGPQVDTFSRQVDDLVERYPEAGTIVKSRLL